MTNSSTIHTSETPVSVEQAHTSVAQAPSPAHVPPSNSNAANSNAATVLQIHRMLLSLLPPDIADEASDFTEALQEYSECAPATIPITTSTHPTTRAIKPSTTSQYMASLSPSLDAVVLHIENNVRLDATGSFVSTEFEPVERHNGVASQRSRRGTALAKLSESTRMEESVMDRVRKMSFRDISSDEKRAVFQLPSVRRSMRHLNHSHVLLRPEILEISSKYMESGPQRASLLQIGHMAAQEQQHTVTYEQEMHRISPLLTFIAAVGGQHPVGYVLANLAIAGEIAFFVVSLQKGGRSDVVSVSAITSAAVALLINLADSFGPAFAPLEIPAARETKVDEQFLGGSCYLQLLGLDVIGRAQEKIAAEKGGGVKSEDSCETGS